MLSSLIVYMFNFWYENIDIPNISARGGWTGLGMEKSGRSPTFFLSSHFSPTRPHTTSLPNICDNMKNSPKLKKYRSNLSLSGSV